MSDEGRALKMFLVAEMKKRKLPSARAFAEFLGVSQSTISLYLKDNPQNSPSLDLLITLAGKTGTPLATVIAFAYPDLAARMEIDPDIELLQRRIANLPKDLRDALGLILDSM